MKTEAETFVELEKLLDGLEPDARKRAADWVAGKYCKAAPSVPSPLGPAVNPPTFIPVPYPAPPVPHPDLGPSPWTWPGGTIVTWGELSPLLTELAEDWNDEDRRRFTQCGGGLVVHENPTVFGPGTSLPTGVVFRN